LSDPVFDILSVGGMRPGLLFLPAVLCGELVPALLDSGAAVNVISEQTVRHFGLTPVPSKPVTLRSAFGELLNCAVSVPVDLSVAGLPITQLFVVAPTPFALLLGTPFLDGLKPLIDWDSKSVSFRGHHGRMHVAEAIPAPLSFVGSLSEVEPDEVLFAISPSSPHAPSTIPPDIAPLVKEFSDIFPDKFPLKLPPRRPGIDHAINLLPDATPPKHRVYRLAPAEDVELKKQLSDLLDSGVVSPSKSPFGAGVLSLPISVSESEHSKWMKGKCQQ
jgi:hypothetical protein